MSKIRLDLRSLSAQMILSLVALVILTAAAAGLPALWRVRSELEHQAWRGVAHGSQAAQALYAAQESKVSGLAALTAQRPTLRELLANGATTGLSGYLRGLQGSAQLDILFLCDREGRVIAQAGEMPVSATCPVAGETTGSSAVFYALPANEGALAWLGAAQRIDSEAGVWLGQAIVGILLDDSYVRQMRAQTGLEHSLVFDGRRLATSLEGPVNFQLPGPTGVSQMIVGGRPYYTELFPLGMGGLQAEVALDVSDVIATQRRLAWALVGSIVGVAAVGSGLGAVLAGRIGRPLTRLAKAVGSLSGTELDQPLAVEPCVREVALVAQALESARTDLHSTLGELRQEKAWTDHLLESIVEGIVTLDRQGHITFFSSGAERITGWSRDQVIGRTCDQIFKPVGAGESFTQLIPAPGGRRKIAVELPDGRAAMLAVTGARLLPPEGDNARVALVFRDVSDEETIYRLLGDFLANVAHEFKTPLSAVAASVELLLDQASDLTATELQELLGSLHLGIVGLQTLVDNLLESASIETGHFRVHARLSSLSEIIADATRTMQPLLDKRHQKLVVEIPPAVPPIQADPRRTVQVLINLLSNAAKHGPDHSVITVGVTRSGNCMRVSVADQGPGIPPDQRPSLFRRFAHPNLPGDTATMGAGLGLWVVKAVVEAQGGEVGIEDGWDGGAVFWFTLPIEGEP